MTWTRKPFGECQDMNSQLLDCSKEGDTQNEISCNCRSASLVRAKPQTGRTHQVSCTVAYLDFKAQKTLYMGGIWQLWQLGSKAGVWTPSFT